MMTVRMVKSKLLSHVTELSERFDVSALYVFGSVARNDSTKKSDIDILVDFRSNRIGLFDFVELKSFLENIFDRKVDLVTRDALHEKLAASVERDSIRVA